jgi:predicted ferric reductase
MAALTRPAPRRRPASWTPPRAQRRARPHSIDIVLLIALNAALILGMWVRHGGLSELTDIGGIATAVGQVTALLGTFLTLLQLLLMSRTPALEDLFGRDRLVWAHRWVGFASVWLIVAHGLFTTLGFAIGAGRNILGEFWVLITTWDFVLMATVSLGLLIAVAITSMRRARRRLSYESWYGVHLYAYLAIALGFAHQLVVGTDFVDDPIARIYWIGLYVLVFGLLIAFRVWTPIVRNLRHRFRVVNVVEEGPGVVSVYLGGRDLDRLAILSGQYLTVRFLGEGWWRAHPYSISAQPNGRWLRLTVKALGDDSARLVRLRIGTRAIVEGPYGNLTTERMSTGGALMIAGGIGITPLRALLEEISASKPVTLLYRIGSERDLIFRRELDRLGQLRGVSVRYLVGHRGRRGWAADPLDADSIYELVPDVIRRDVYICGPTSMMAAVESALRQLGVPARRIHQERFFDDPVEVPA